MTAPDQLDLWEPHDALSERAADFFERRRSGEWTDTDQAEFGAWLAESTSHHVAWLRVEEIAARAERLAALNALELKRMERSGEGKRRYRRFLLRRSAASADYAQTRRSHLRRRVVLPLLAAASIALLAAIGFPLVNSILQPPPDRTYATDVGGHALIKFADKTQVELNTDTVVRSRMTTAERTVWLEKGEAWFRVAHDAAHPFSVVVGRHRITDLGTEFLVRRGADGVEVALLNGRAAFDTDGAAAVVLAPGEDAVATPTSMSVTRKTPQELADALAWRRGMLVFRNARLADAVREVNRYNTIKLVIADPAIADLKFNGEIRNDNFEGFLRIAETMMKLRVDREGNEVLISRGPRDATKRAAHVKRGP